MTSVGALGAIVLVLCEVFVPTLVSPACGRFYQQFAVEIRPPDVISLVLRSLVAHATCDLLKPQARRRRRAGMKSGRAGQLQPQFERMSDVYASDQPARRRRRR